MKIAKIYKVKNEKPVKVGAEKYKIEDLEEINSLIGKNRFVDPGFKSVSVNYVQNPEKFDFTLSGTSPALGYCPVLENIPIVDDLSGRARKGKKLDAGCYGTR